MSGFQIFTQPSQQALDTAANALSGATLTFTLTGTSTPTNAFSDSALTTPVANPLSANSAGVFIPVFLDPTIIYRVVLKTQAGAVLQTWDPANEQLLTQALIGFYLNPRTAAEISAGVTPVNYAYTSHSSGFVLPERYGAVGNGNAADTANGALDTTAIAAAVKIAAATGTPLLLSRQYIAVPATVTTQESIAITVAWVMQSNLHVVGERGASITLANSQSTDAAVVNLALFHTNSVLSNVSFSGVIFDLNGANNKISPSRPATYNNSYNMAAISVSGTPAGVAARIDDALIEDCTFKNCPGVCVVVCAQSNTANVTLGKRWEVRNNLFLNNGTDTDDHTSLYGWCDYMEVEGNWFWQDSPPHTVGKTGGVTCYEIHGTDHRATNNLFLNYAIGVRLCTNATVADDILRTIITDNAFVTSHIGVNIERPVAGQAAMGIIEIANNIFYFSDYTFAGAQAYKDAIGIDGGYSIFDVKIRGNQVFKSGATTPGVFVFANTVGVASQAYTNFTICDNSANGCAIGVFASATASSAGFGNLEISRNDFVALAPDATTFTTAIGISISATAGIKTLTIDSNRFVDEQGSPTFAQGILLNSGTITDLWLGPQTYKGLTSTPYSEGGGITITNRIGPYGFVTITYSASMTPDASKAPFQTITATNGTAFTVNAPTKGTVGQLLTIRLKNASGGALGAATWNGTFKMSAWTNPANGWNRSITFFNDGANWCQITQTGVDVPN